jgi:hypothetical protein
MSKLNTVEMLEVTVPLSPVPAEVSGDDESTRTIRWGIS